MQIALAVEVRVGEIRSHALLAGGEGGEREMAAGGQGAVEKSRVADPPVGRQVVETP